jgi:hypothetical protein
VPTDQAELAKQEAGQRLTGANGSSGISEHQEVQGQAGLTGANGSSGISEHQEVQGYGARKKTQQRHRNLLSR